VCFKTSLAGPGREQPHLVLGPKSACHVGRPCAPSGAAPFAATRAQVLKPFLVLFVVFVFFVVLPSTVGPFINSVKAAASVQRRLPDVPWHEAHRAARVQRPAALN
jgi:hypothetical protein